MCKGLDAPTAWSDRPALDAAVGAETSVTGAGGRATAATGKTLYSRWRAQCDQEQVPVTDEAFDRVVRPPTRPVNQAIREFDETGRRLHVDHAILAARRALGWKEKTRLSLLAWLFEQLEGDAPMALPQVPGPVSAVIPHSAVLSLNAMARYACMDAANFAQVAFPPLKSQVLNREWHANRDPDRVDCYGRSQGDARQRTFKTRHLEHVSNLVVEGRVGICTTFGMAAGDHLVRALEATGSRIGRVECISGENHCFVVVNRARSDRDRRDGQDLVIPTRQYWGDEFILVDPWAGSLGHPVFYWRDDGFPEQLRIYLTSRITQQFDSLTSG